MDEVDEGEASPCCSPCWVEGEGEVSPCWGEGEGAGELDGYGACEVFRDGLSQWGDGLGYCWGDSDGAGDGWGGF